ncbi:MAG: 3-deoxy-7-phosphoheptulonate synthase, partial [Anaerovoracaceae bacterium]
YVRPMALAAVAAGADGLMIEVHNNPSCALCDGAQSLTPEAFSKLSKDVSKLRECLCELE